MHFSHKWFEYNDSLAIHLVRNNISAESLVTLGGTAISS